MTPCGACRQRIREFAAPETPDPRRGSRGHPQDASRSTSCCRFLRAGQSGHDDGGTSTADRTDALRKRPPSCAARGVRRRRSTAALVLGTGLGGADAMNCAIPIAMPYAEIPALSGERRLGPCRAARRGTPGGQARRSSSRAARITTRPATRARCACRSALVRALGIPRARPHQCGRLAAAGDPARAASSPICDHINLSGANPLIGDHPRRPLRVADRTPMIPSCAQALQAAAPQGWDRAAGGRLCLVLGAELRDAGRDPHGAGARRAISSACRPCRR